MLSSVCFAMRPLSFLANTERLRTLFLAHFHLVMSYGIIFWGNSTNSNKVLLMQNKTVRTVARVHISESCKGFFNRFCTLTLASEYMFAFITLTVNNYEIF
jgi:hypothetical protein